MLRALIPDQELEAVVDILGLTLVCCLGGQLCIGSISGWCWGFLQRKPGKSEPKRAERVWAGQVENKAGRVMVVVEEG